MTRRPLWSPGARRLGTAGALGVLAVGILYVSVIGLWLVVERTPGDPIGDPYLAVMEGLTILSALSLVAMAAGVACFASPSRRIHGLLSLAVGSLAAGLTLAVHFVQLTAVRQMWRAGALGDYRLVWPSPVFAVEYLAWDLMVGLTLLLGARALGGDGEPESPGVRPAGRALAAGGVLCLAGLLGPASGHMALQNIAVVGYALVLPLAAALLARLFLASEAA